MPNCVEVRDRQLAPGSRAYTIENFFAGEKLRAKITFALVSHKAYVGSYQLNPLKFSSHGLEEISLTIDNQTEKYTIDEQGGNYLQLYLAVASQAGGLEELKGAEGLSQAPIKYEQLLKEFAFYPFDIAPSRTGSDFSKPRVGNVRVDLKFKEKFAEPLELLCFFENTRMFLIDKSRKVIPSM